MHIADGVLPVSLCVGGYVLALAGSVVGGRRLQPDEVPRMGILAAAAFVASSVHFPVAGTSVHFGLLGLLGMLLGLRAVPVIFAVLLVQAFLFQHGGFLTLGVNAVNLSMGAICGHFVWRVGWAPVPVRALLAGFVGIFVPAQLVLLEFQVAGYGRSLMLLAGAYAVLAAIEGVFTGFVVAFLGKARPGILGPPMGMAPVPARVAVNPARMSDPAVTDR